MQKTKVIAKLQKLGAKVEQQNQAVYATFEGKKTIYIGVNPDGECHSFGVVLGYDNIQQESDMDWRDNLTQVIRAATR
jgi:hypothetical protein